MSRETPGTAHPLQFKNVIAATAVAVLSLSATLTVRAQGPAPVPQMPALGEAPTAAELLNELAQLERTAQVVDPATNTYDTSEFAQSLNIANRESVLAFYNTRDVASGVSWTGNQTSCTPGDTPQAVKDAVVNRINFFRAMAGVPAVITLSPTYNAAAQKAALMFSANGALSHTPPSTWKCYTAEGGSAAGKSNIGLGIAGSGIIDLYMRDYGASNAAVGHRRWFLYPQTQQMGSGDVAASNGLRAANTVWVMDGRYGVARPNTRDGFVAWPPPGFVPYPLVYPRWSFSYPGADFSLATISMVSNGVSMPVRRESVANGYGENTVVWLPNNLTDSASWPKPAADEVIDVAITNVKISGVARDFAYRVTVIDTVSTNNAPIGIGSANTAISETLPLSSTITNLVVDDADTTDTHSFTFVAGAGDADNSAFTIVGNRLLNRAALDYERATTMTVRVRATDAAGASYVQAVTLNILDVNEPAVLGGTSLLLLRQPNGGFRAETTVTDPENKTLQLTVVDAPAGITVKLVGGKIVVEGTPAAGQTGGHATMQLTDADGVRSEHTLLLQAATATLFLPTVGR